MGKGAASSDLKMEGLVTAEEKAILSHHINLFLIWKNHSDEILSFL